MIYKLKILSIVLSILSSIKKLLSTSNTKSLNFDGVYVRSSMINDFVSNDEYRSLVIMNSDKPNLITVSLNFIETNILVNKEYLSFNISTKLYFIMKMEITPNSSKQNIVKQKLYLVKFGKNLYIIDLYNVIRLNKTIHKFVYHSKSEFFVW